MSLCFVTAVLEERGERERIGGKAHVKGHGPRQANLNPSFSSLVNPDYLLPPAVRNIEHIEIKGGLQACYYTM